MSPGDPTRRIVMTGAAGRIGKLLRQHLSGSLGYELVLFDRDDRGESGVRTADLSRFTPDWTGLFAGADAVVHLAGNAWPLAPWWSLADNNIEATLNVLRAAAEHDVRRVVYASSLRTMEGYRYGRGPIAADAPPRPDTFYAASKLVSEMLARRFAEERGLSTICLRIGHAQTDGKPPTRKFTTWRLAKWLSGEDLCQAVEKAILAEDVRFAVLPLVSDNEGMRWDLSETRRVLGYAPTGGTTPHSPILLTRIRSALAFARKRLFDPAWRHYWD